MSTINPKIPPTTAELDEQTPMEFPRTPAEPTRKDPTGGTPGGGKPSPSNPTTRPEANRPGRAIGDDGDTPDNANTGTGIGGTTTPQKHGTGSTTGCGTKPGSGKTGSCGTPGGV